MAGLQWCFAVLWCIAFLVACIWKSQDSNGDWWRSGVIIVVIGGGLVCSVVAGGA